MNKRIVLALLAFAIALALPRYTIAQIEFGEQKVKEPYNWEKDATRRGLGEKEIQQLRKDKVLISNREFKQVFDPYVRHGHQFITSDSLLNAFHVLYQESVTRLEGVNARKLEMILPMLMNEKDTSEPDPNPGLFTIARRRNQIIIGTAQRLMGIDKLDLGKDITDIIEQEVKLITEAKEMRKPKWLGPPDDGFIAIDYSRYKPRGFYSKSERLSRYFRAVSWLQSIPFRPAKDVELASILLFGRRLNEAKNENPSMNLENANNFFRLYSRFLGTHDDLDLIDVSEVLRGSITLDAEGLPVARRQLAERRHHPLINDQVAFPSTNGTQSVELSFRIISAYRTPDAVLFHHTTNLRNVDRSFPAGLEVPIALGSSFARSKITCSDKDLLLATIDNVFTNLPNEGLYCEYLDCLRVLFNKPEPDAPAFMKSEAWQAKNCQTVLAGWAQIRHTWVLQIKENSHSYGIAMLPSGFVEPVPGFFAKMTALVNKTEEALKNAGAFKTDSVFIADELREVARILKKVEPNRAFTKDGDARLTEDETSVLSKWREELDQEFERDRWIRSEGISITRTNKAGETIELYGTREYKSRYENTIEVFNSKADRIEKSGSTADPELNDLLKYHEMKIDVRWRKLGDLCRRLEALSHKQLRGAPFSKEEQEFFKGGYGEELGYIMFYEGNSYESPLDDAPRIVDVFSNPQRGQYLEVGVGRPRAIYVLYPAKEGEVLCIGAVMPYYEFTSSERMTDAEWKQMLDSSKRPPQPDWIKPITGTQVEPK